MITMIIVLRVLAMELFSAAMGVLAPSISPVATLQFIQISPLLETGSARFANPILDTMSPEREYSPLSMSSLTSKILSLSVFLKTSASISRASRLAKRVSTKLCRMDGR
jgi:hypothetical protein